MRGQGTGKKEISLPPFKIWVAAGRERKREVGGRLGAFGTHREDRGSSKAGSKGRNAWAG